MSAVLDDFEFDAAKMDPQVKEVWIESLESGNYLQGRGQLCVTADGRDYFCCLGVLLDTCADAEWEEMPMNENGDTNWGMRDGVAPRGLNEVDIPESYLEEFKLAWEVTGHLANANDQEISFRQIAQFIRVNL